MSVSHSHGTQTHAHPELSFLRKYIFSEDHKIIGIQFLFSTLIFLFIGGALAMFVRMQLVFILTRTALPCWVNQPAGSWWHKLLLSRAPAVRCRL